MASTSSAARALNTTNSNERTSVGSFVTLAGRILFSAIFILSGFFHFSPQEVAYAANAGVPMPGFLVPASGVLAMVGGLSILLGYRAKDRRLVGGVLPGSGNARNAQLLGSQRPDDGADANGDVHEERDHDWSGAAHLAIWSGIAKSGCAKEFGPLTCRAALRIQRSAFSHPAGEPSTEISEG
jgi:hypothetical protein